MRKTMTVLIAQCLILALIAGCADKGGSSSESNDPNPQAASVVSGSVDVDLTTLSSTVVYAEVYNMLTRPEGYMGKTIKLNGPYASSYYAETDLNYHYVIIEDAAACCQNGLEFIWNGEHRFPDDYPEEESRIEVIGVFGSYEELGRTYYYLSVDNLSILGK